MKRTPKISEAEWEVMKVLWENSPLTANEIVETLSKQTRWQRETIRTLINRLVQKKAVAFEKEGRQHHYYPVVAEAECVKAETRSLLRRLRVSAIEPMLAALVEEQRLSAEQIARLKEILDGKDVDARHRKPE
ncbi:MAG: BlaI/MecI/CopY family transcriptional regulator [Phycisphaerae bacterium]|nr:BlaI/MecI/CopY family transcriptional regulator [Phycisphaerae bacterium]